MLLRNSIRFGKGLQLVNILRDLPKDLRLGRCYVPEDRLKMNGLTPKDLLKPENVTRFRPLYDSYLDLAGTHLQAGWDYTNDLPYLQVRLRLACAWPILIGIATLKKLRTAQMLDPSHRVKVSRAEIRWIVLRSIIWYAWLRKWRNLAVENF
jgi:farnesyl-diphosphate farnesyltransferase